MSLTYILRCNDHGYKENVLKIYKILQYTKLQHSPNLHLLFFRVRLLVTRKLSWPTFHAWVTVVTGLEQMTTRGILWNGCHYSRILICLFCMHTQLMMPLWPWLCGIYAKIAFSTLLPPGAYYFTKTSCCKMFSWQRQEERDLIQ